MKQSVTKMIETEDIVPLFDEDNASIYATSLFLTSHRDLEYISKLVGPRTRLFSPILAIRVICDNLTPKQKQDD